LSTTSTAKYSWPAPTLPFSHRPSRNCQRLRLIRALGKDVAGRKRAGCSLRFPVRNRRADTHDK
jgi:hypothetical protein